MHLWAMIRYRWTGGTENTILLSSLRKYVFLSIILSCYTSLLRFWYTQEGFPAVIIHGIQKTHETYVTKYFYRQI